MNISAKLNTLERLRKHLSSNDSDLQAVKEQAYRANGWFIPEFTEKAIQNICQYYLDGDRLQQWLRQYPGLGEGPARSVGIVAAGNIPLVGFHDWLCGFVSGHEVRMKLSSKDEVLMKHILEKIAGWSANGAQTRLMDMLKGCDAYIATGSNNSASYFHYYFARYPHIIRRNRTSAAILTGSETAPELEALADDIMLYFGLGCRNVTKVFVPEGYDFDPLLRALERYDYLMDYHKYKNNYDYNLALLMLNRTSYLTNGSILLRETEFLFSPLGVLHYGYYTDAAALTSGLQANEDLQCLVGQAFTPFGTAQQPSLTDYADGVDTMAFLTGI